MVNQETGVRGFALGQDEALPGAVQRRSAARRAPPRARCASYLRGYPDLLAELRRARRRLDVWQDDGRGADHRPGARRRPDRRTRPPGRRRRGRRSTGSGSRRRSSPTASTRCGTRSPRTASAPSPTCGSRSASASAILLITGLAARAGGCAGGARPDRRPGGPDPPGRRGLPRPRRSPRTARLEIQDLGRGRRPDARDRLAAQIVRIERARSRIQQRSAELARSNADLEQFAYVASHDLSEPLRKVTNFCQLLERQYADQLDDKARQYIGFMVDGAKRMQALINDLLDFSRVGRIRPSTSSRSTSRWRSTGPGQPRRSRSPRRGAVIVHDPLPTVPGRPHAAHRAAAEPGRQRRQVPQPGPALRGSGSAPSAHGDELAADRRRQRDRHRPAVRRPDLHDLPAAAPARPVRRHRHRPRAVPQDRRLPPWPHLAGREARARC